MVTKFLVGSKIGIFKLALIIAKRSKNDKFLRCPLIREQIVRTTMKLSQKLIRNLYLGCCQFIKFFKNLRIFIISNLFQSHFSLAGQ